MQGKRKANVMTKDENIGCSIINFELQINDNLPVICARYAVMSEQITTHANLPPELMTINDLIDNEQLEYVIEQYENGLNALHDILNGRKGGIER